MLTAMNGAGRLWQRAGGLWCVKSLFSVSVCNPGAALRGCVCSEATNPQAQL